MLSRCRQVSRPTTRGGFWRRSGPGSPRASPCHPSSPKPSRRPPPRSRPHRERALVLSHNDINPTNFVYDGRNILFLDWDTAGQNDPFYDLAVVSMFLRMDEGACAKLLAAYDDAPIARLPARFA